MGQGHTQTSNATCQRPPDWWNAAPLWALPAELTQKLETMRRDYGNTLKLEATLQGSQWFGDKPLTISPDRPMDQ